MKIKWIAGLAAMCLFSAIVASAVTALAIRQGAFGLIQPSTGATTDSSQTSGTTSISPSPSPSAEPTLTPVPTERPSDPNTVESFMLLQTQDMIEKIYTSISPSVVAVEVKVTDSGTSVSMTNQGSGLILNKSGHIVTNAGILSIALDKQGNVLSNATIQVKIQGIDTPFAAELTGQDVLTGIAVLKIDPLTSPIVPAVFAANSTLRIGQLVLAVGYPEILFESGGLSSGLITGLNRAVNLEDGTTVQMIQTNTPISLDCSGGPLLNMDGEVIGLTNCAIERDAIDSLSYALPIKTIQGVTRDLIENGYVTGRSWLGASVLTESNFLILQRTYGYPNGLYVNNVIKNSPAYVADLRRGDIIVKINDDAVATSMDLSKFLQNQPVGTLIKIRVFRRTDSLYHDLSAYLQEKIN